MEKFINAESVRLGRLSDLELWRDMRVSEIEGAQCCMRARVSQPNASGLLRIKKYSDIAFFYMGELAQSIDFAGWAGLDARAN